MGAQLALAALDAASAVHAEHAPARVFVFMALTALDGDAHPVYFAGRGRLADALGKNRDDAGYRAVARVSAQLVASGLVAVSSPPAPGHPSRISLLDGRGGPLNPSDTRRSASSESYSHDAQRPANTRRPASERVTLSVRTGDAQRHREEEEELQEKGKDAPASTRTCTRHNTWVHDDPCRACARDRQAVEAAAAARRPATMSPRSLDCGPGRHVRLPDGTCTRCENRDPLREGAA